MFRLHITCPAKHTTYRDYKHHSSAMRAWRRSWVDTNGWYGTHIELLSSKR